MQSYQSDAMAMFGLPPDSDMDLLMKTISDRPSPPSQDHPTSASSAGSAAGPQASNMRPLFPMSEERSNGLFGPMGIHEQQHQLHFSGIPQPMGSQPTHYNQLENWQSFLGGLGIDQLQGRLPLY